MARRARTPRQSDGEAAVPGVPDAPDASAGRSLTQRGVRTRARLLTAAREVFSQVGFSDVRVTDITTRAGVASGTFYTYFDSKEAVFREVAGQVLAEMQIDPRGDPDNTARDPVRDLEYGTRCYFACIRRNARIARSIEEMHMREPGLGSERREILVRGVKQVERWIRMLQRRGICDPKVEPWPTALALHAMTVSTAYDHLVHRDAPEETDTLVQATTNIWRSTVGLKHQ
jgi:AcrR family transcriptional regulator